ncbi:MAG: aldolase [Chloroflexi bacterium]|nr:MAG: aldolase [Chloroflexota bacterium]MBL1193531.1 aldolase [Chloroflexota bacterium]NOH10822.1 aldolase [Chloroflexota bacterium]
MNSPELNALLEKVENSIEVHGEHIHVTNADALRKNIDKLVEASSFGEGASKFAARWLVRSAALELGAIPASIQDLYMGRGRGEVPLTFTVPAINLRALAFDAAKAVFRVAGRINGAAILFELARSEMSYTEQRPSEYATNIMAAAIAEGYEGPVFIQGDHFQVSPSRYEADAESELQAVRDLTKEALEAGFYNIDVDTSTLVDISKEDVKDQQILNTTLSAMFTKYIRDNEPDGVTVSVGGEIGEVGTENSTEEELRAYTDGFNAELAKLDADAVGLSKISIQTGTSHGGTVLPDGSVAEVAVDFERMKQLSQIARLEYGTAGAVQHGASTLPMEAFGKFVEYEACEVHLATNFQNMLYDRLPDELYNEVKAYLDKNNSNERKEGQTDEQFYYKTRKRAIGAFKRHFWDLPADKKAEICQAWEDQFTQLFDLLGIADTRQYVEKHVTPVKVLPSFESYVAMAGEVVVEEDTSDLAD